MYNGKVIYNPSGKAGEYSYWAANFYNGCSARCEYCYNRKGIVAKVLGGNVPTLKKSLKDERTALKIFQQEMIHNIDALRKHGLFFNFVSDPFLPETHDLNMMAIHLCLRYSIPVKTLTKQTWWVDELFKQSYQITPIIAFGFTLTGHDELEPGAASNMKRIQAMKKLHDAGYKVFASIEPIIDFASSYRMIKESEPYCDHYKIGLKSGSSHHFELVRSFLDDVFELLPTKPIYLKDSILKGAGVKRDSIELPSNCVDRSWNL